MSHVGVMLLSSVTERVKAKVITEWVLFVLLERRFDFYFTF